MNPTELFKRWIKQSKSCRDYLRDDLNEYEENRNLILEDTDLTEEEIKEYLDEAYNQGLNEIIESLKNLASDHELNSDNFMAAIVNQAIKEIDYLEISTNYLNNHLMNLNN